MKKTIFILLSVGFTLSAVAQKTTNSDTTCSFLKSLNLKNGIDTIEIKATLNDFMEGSDEPMLSILNDEKKLQSNEYINVKGSHSISFIPIDCNQSYQGTLSRKVYDKTYIRKTNDLEEYMKGIVDVNGLKPGDIVHLKCVVFENKKLKDELGAYFFTIIDLKIL